MAVRPVNKEGVNLSNYLVTDERSRVRSCLNCKQDFRSYHAGNRICPRCETLDSFQNDRAGYQPTGFLRK